MLSESKIRWLWSEAHNDTSDRMAYQVLAEMVEAEVRKQDDALIQQMLEALKTCIQACDYLSEIESVANAQDAALARLENTMSHHRKHNRDDKRERWDFQPDWRDERDSDDDELPERDDDDPQPANTFRSQLRGG